MQRLTTCLKRRSLTIYFVGNFKIAGSLQSLSKIFDINSIPLVTIRSYSYERN